MKTCQKCSKLFPNWITIDGKKRNLSNRLFCFDCSPWGEKNRINLLNPESRRKKQTKQNVPTGYRECQNCSKILPLTNQYFYKRGDRGESDYHFCCRECYSLQSKTKQKLNKYRAVDYLGGKCSKCGYNKCIAALEFHHLDPSIKDTTIARIGNKNFENIKSELDKCILLCAICHREYHWKAFDLEYTDYMI